MVVIFNNKHHGNNDISQYYNNIPYISRLGYVLLQIYTERWTDVGGYTYTDTDRCTE
jgi:hypothetical protein